MEVLYRWPMSLMERKSSKQLNRTEKLMITPVNFSTWTTIFFPKLHSLFVAWSWTYDRNFLRWTRRFATSVDPLSAYRRSRHARTHARDMAARPQRDGPRPWNPATCQKDSTFRNSESEDVTGSHSWQQKELINNKCGLCQTTFSLVRFLWCSAA